MKTAQAKLVGRRGVRTVTVTVKVQVPVTASRRSVALYVHEAVESWKGQFDPDSDLFDLQVTHVYFIDKGRAYKILTG